MVSLLANCDCINFQHRDRLESLICELEAEGFFSVDDDSIEWVLMALNSVLLLLYSACKINKCFT
jgi:hypothetical protein